MFKVNLNQLLQLFITLLIIVLSPNNIIALIALLIWWKISFKRLTKTESLFFIISSIIYIVGDIGAIKNGFFKFNKPDFLGLPYWEFVAWGFWFLHVHRTVKVTYPKNIYPIIYPTAFIFFLSFSVIKDQTILMSLHTIILLGLIIYQFKYDKLFYALYMCSISIIVELIGIHFNLWQYPQGLNAQVFFQFCLLWTNSILFYYFIAGPFLEREKQAHKELAY